MKLIVKTAALNKVLTEAVDAIPNNSAEPSYYNFLFEVTSKTIEIIASDGNATLKTTLNSTDGDKQIILDAEPGKVQIPARFFLDIIKMIKADTVTIQTADSNLLTVEAQGAKYRLNSTSASEYPDVYMDFDESKAMKVSHADFCKLFNSTSFAAASKNSKQCFTGINIFTKDGRLYFKATDAYRLAQRSIELPGAPETEFTVATKVIGMIAKKADAETVEFEANDNKAIFRAGDTIFQSRLYAGEFPDVDKLYPKALNYHLRARAEDILECLRQVTVVIRDSQTQGPTTLTCSADSCEFTASSQEYGEAKGSLSDFTFEGGMLRIAFNAKYVAEAITALNSEDVTLDFVGDSAVFLARSSDPFNVQIITPMRQR
ncbi:MAG TPA: DNA polymerase III subunit beta [Firmicutes bacterium]|nr:DNA polymerase III subunit beta [Bacillota bacterium]